MLGIKQADGSFYAILDESDGKSKKVVLTTSHEHQKGVKVPIYRGEGESMDNPRPVGVLTLDVDPDNREDSELQLTMGLDENGVFSGTLEDTGSGEKQHLSISMEDSINEMNAFDVPDFDLEPEEGITAQDILDEFPDAEDVAGYSEEEPEEFANTLEDDSDSFEGTSFNDEYGDDTLDDTEYEDSIESTIPGDEGSTWTPPMEEDPPEKKGKGLVKVGFIALALALIAVLVVLWFSVIRGEDNPPLQTQGDTENTENQIVTPEPEPEAEAKAEAEAEPEAAPEIPTVVMEEEKGDNTPVDPRIISYIIRWGDTLWDLSATYYRNPWLYGHLANFNEIKDPDLIYAGETLLIPEK